MMKTLRIVSICVVLAGCSDNPDRVVEKLLETYVNKNVSDANELIDWHGVSQDIYGKKVTESHTEQVKAETSYWIEFNKLPDDGEALNIVHWFKASGLTIDGISSSLELKGEQSAHGSVSFYLPRFDTTISTPMELEKIEGTWKLKHIKGLSDIHLRLDKLEDNLKLKLNSRLSIVERQIKSIKSHQVTKSKGMWSKSLPVLDTIIVEFETAQKFNALEANFEYKWVVKELQGAVKPEKIGDTMWRAILVSPKNKNVDPRGLEHETALSLWITSATTPEGEIIKPHKKWGEYTNREVSR